MAAEPLLTVAEIARARRISQGKILGWIHAGELTAINVAASLRGRRPRWRISAEALELFDSARTSRPTPKPIRRKRTPNQNIVEFF